MSRPCARPAGAGSDAPGATRIIGTLLPILVAGLFAVPAAALASGCSAGPIDAIDLAPDSLRNGLVAHWSFDDGAGDVLSDRSGNRRDGAITGATWIAGRFGGALHFGGDGAVTVPSFPVATASYSVAGWIRPPAGDFGDTLLTMISTELVFAGGWEMNAKLTPADTQYHFGYWIGPGDSDYVYYPCACVTADTWTHLAAVVDGAAGQLSFYRDGVLQGRSPATRAILPGTATLYMGRWDMTGRLLTGDLDDFAIYNRALVAGEVAQLAGAPAPDPR